MPHIEGLAKGHELMSAERRLGKPLPHQVTKCPRCESPDTKFCYFNNYSTTQPRFFCKNCKRYWTHGGALRNVPVGGGLRKNKKSKQKANTSTSSSSSSSTHHHKPSTSSPSTNVDDHTTHSLPNPPGYPPSPPNRNFLFNPRIYEAGDHATHALSYHHLSYKNMPQLYPGYSYPPPLSMEGLQQGGLGAAYSLLDPSRSQSNNGEASEISAEPRSEAMKETQFAPPPVVGFNIERSSYGLQASDHTTREGFHASIVAREDHQRPKDDNNNNNNSDGNNNYSNIMQSLGYGDELHQAKWRGRAIPSKADGVLNFDSEEGLANAVNVHDWQQISEGLCGGAGDFFYMPTQYPVTWSDLDAGTSF